MKSIDPISSLTNTEVLELRKDFPILTRKVRSGKPLVYLDWSATSQKPIQVLDAEYNFYSQHNAAVNRGTHLLADESTADFEQAKLTLANFIGAHEQEIVWTKNATEAVNLVAYALDNANRNNAGLVNDRFRLTVGDEICVTRAEHHANLVPWQELCFRTGATLRWLDLTPDGRIDLNTLDNINSKTKLVAFTHVYNVTGAISPVAEIVAAARKVNALVLLDCCQSAGHLALDVKQLDVDFAVFSAHKMLSTNGIGALYARQEILDDLPVFITGGGIVENVTMEKTSYKRGFARFEAGTQPVGAAIAWMRALEYLTAVGMQRIEAYDKVLTKALVEAIISIPGITILGPTDLEQRIGIVAFAIDGIHPHDIGQVLDDYGVAIRVGHHCAIPLHKHFGVNVSARASTSFLTTLDEINVLHESLKQVIAFFGGKIV